MSLESSLLRWNIANPSSQSLPLVDIKGDGSLYAVKYTFAQAGSDDFPASDEEFQIIRAAFQAYSNLPGSALRFSEDSGTVSTPKIANDGINTLFWDENGSTVTGGNIPDDQLALAVVSFNSSTGELQDVDIRFNGQDYKWTSQGANGTTSIDLLSVALYQIGLMIGLDTSFYDASSTSPATQSAMFPLIAGERLRAGLSQDDRSGVAAIYPNENYSSLFGSISGRVRQTNGTFPIYGAHVIAFDAKTGSPAVTTLTGSGALADDPNGNLLTVNSGNFTLHGLPPGDYYVAVQPLAGGLANETHLQSAYPLLNSFNTDFIAEIYNENDASNERGDARSIVRVNAGENTSGVNIVANALTKLLLDDSSSVVYTIKNFAFPFYGQSYTRAHIHSDGYVTFGEALIDGSESAAELFSGPPRIAGLWDDLNPGALGANVSVVESGSIVSVIYTMVPEKPSQGASTFTINLHSDGMIELEYGLVASMDDGIVGIAPGGGVQNTESNFGAFSGGAAFQAGLPIFEQFLGTGDDGNDPGTNDGFDLNGAKIQFKANAQGGYDASLNPSVNVTPTPTVTPTITPTPNPNNIAPKVTIDPSSASLFLGEAKIILVTAADPDSSSITFTDIPKNSGTFGEVISLGNGLFATTYAILGTAGNLGERSITIFASDGQSSGLAFLNVSIDGSKTPTPTNTPVIIPTPTLTPTPTLPPNQPPIFNVNPKIVEMIVGETKAFSVTVNDLDGHAVTLVDSPKNIGKFDALQKVGNFTLTNYRFTAAPGQEGALTITLSASDGIATATQDIQIVVFAQGTQPTSTPTPTKTPTITNTPTITPTVTMTPTATPTVNMAPVIVIQPAEASLTDGATATVSLTVSDPNRDLITFDLIDPKKILETISFSSAGSSISARYLFSAKISTEGVNYATFVASDGQSTTAKAFKGTVLLKPTPTPTPAPQGDIVVAQGESGNSFAHRRQIPGITIAPGSAFNGMPAAFASVIGSPATREIYVSSGDIDGDGGVDIVTTFGPYAPFSGAFPNMALVRDSATRRLVGHSFHAFPHTSSLSVNNPYGEVRTAVGRVIPSLSGNQIITAHGTGGNNVIRVWEYTGAPAPNGFRVAVQFEGLVSIAGNANQSGAVSVAAGDLTGDGVAEILVGQTNSETSKTLIQAIHIDSNLRIIRSQTYQAFPSPFQGEGGVNLAIGDLNGDGVNEIIATSMGNPEGSAVNGAVMKNFASLLKPKTRSVFGISIVDTFEAIPNGVFSVFANEENPSGAVTVSAGDLVPGGGDEVVFGTSSILRFIAANGTTTPLFPAPQALARAVQLQFGADGGYVGMKSVIANRTGTFRPFAMDNPHYSGGVNVSIRGLNSTP